MWRLGWLGVLLVCGAVALAPEAWAQETPKQDVPSSPEGAQSPEPDELPGEEKPDPIVTPETPGPVVVDPDLTGIVMKVGPATEEDLRRGYVNFRGRLKVDLNYDFRPIGNEEDFVPASIPIDSQLRGPNMNFNARQSRLFFEGGKLTGLGPIIGHVSADFYGEGSSGGDFRVYEAYASIGPLLAGRKWTAFMDLDAIPDTLDFQGPGSLLASRREVMRYGPTLGPLLVQLSLERPVPDVTLSNADTEATRTPIPDVIVALEYGFAEGRHVRAAGLARWLSYYELGGTQDVVVGWGAMLSGLWTWGRNGSRTSLQVHYGSGSGNYVSDMVGRGLDAVVVAPGRLETVSALAVYGSIEPHWTEHLASSFAYGYLEVFPLEAQPGTTLKRTHYLSGNVRISPVPSFEFGPELLFGRRVDKDGRGANALRLILSTRFFF
jgi:hypothetical protein